MDRDKLELLIKNSPIMVTTSCGCMKRISLRRGRCLVECTFNGKCPFQRKDPARTHCKLYQYLYPIKVDKMMVDYLIQSAEKFDLKEK